MNVFNYWKEFYNFKNPLNWWRLPRYWFKSLKYAYQRATKGFSGWDLYNLHNFYLKLFEKTLTEFADKRYGSPDEDHDKWTARYKEIALKFHSALEENEFYKNEYADAFFDSFGQFDFEFERLEIGLYKLIECVRKDNAEEIQRLYREREEEIFKSRDRDMKAGFDMLKEDFWGLWD